MRRAALRQRAVPRGCPLTQRELEILANVAVGRRNRDIAARLGLSEQTVKNRFVTILKKMHAANGTGAVVLALRNGWLRLDALDVELRDRVSEVA